MNNIDTYLGPDLLALARVVGLTLGHHWAGMDEPQFPCYDCAEMSLAELRKSADMALDASYPAGICAPTVRVDRRGDVSLAVATPGCRLLVYGDSLRDCVALVAGRWRGIVAWAGRGEVSPAGLRDFVRELVPDHQVCIADILSAMRRTHSASVWTDNRSRAMPRHLPLLNDFLMAVQAVEDDFPDHFHGYTHALQSVCSDAFRSRVNDALWKARAARETTPERFRRAVSERDTPEARRRKRIAEQMFEALADHFPPGGGPPRFRVPVPVLRECSLLQADWYGVDGRLYDVIVKSVTHD